MIGNYIWPNYYVGTSYAAEVSWMNTWITQRLAFLDKNWFYDFTGTEDPLVLKPNSVYPNPFDNQITVQWSNEGKGEAAAELFNASGMLVWKKTIVLQKGEIMLNIEDDKPLNAGMYLLRIHQNGMVQLAEKVIKR